MWQCQFGVESHVWSEVLTHFISWTHLIIPLSTLLHWWEALNGFDQQNYTKVCKAVSNVANKHDQENSLLGQKQRLPSWARGWDTMVQSQRKLRPNSLPPRAQECKSSPHTPPLSVQSGPDERSEYPASRVLQSQKSMWLVQMGASTKQAKTKLWTQRNSTQCHNFWHGRTLTKNIKSMHNCYVIIFWTRGGLQPRDSLESNERKSLWELEKNGKVCLHSRVSRVLLRSFLPVAFCLCVCRLIKWSQIGPLLRGSERSPSSFTSFTGFTWFTFHEDVVCWSR